MFKLIHHFIKETLISFYKSKDKYNVQKRIIKHNKTLSQEEFIFEEDEFIDFIKTCFIENTQTYVSTIIDTFNQGCVDSCSHSKYREVGINLDNIKILCLKDYSIFIGLYEINQFEKEMKKFKVDYIFSPYLLIDLHKKETNNSIYILYTDSFVIVLIYEDAKKPKYSNIYQFKFDESNEKVSIEENHEDDLDAFDDIDDLVDDIEEIESLDDTLDEDIESIDDISDTEHIEDEQEEIEEEMSDVKNEIETIDFIKNSIKDYYESYSDNFLEYGYILYSDAISHKFVKDIENETFLEIKKEKIDILSIINDLATKELNV